jgi:methionyl-tRNA synthetase
MSKSIFVSTTIPYVNARPHVGIALELVQADIWTRVQKLLGHQVLFQTGTDENSTKSVRAAQANGVTVHDHVEQHSLIFQNLVDRLGILPDCFNRTSHKGHHDSVREFIARLDQQDIYEAPFSGFYCAGCEDFLKVEDLINGQCADHAAPPEWTEERNVFFRLSRYQTKLQQLIETDAICIRPFTRKNEVLSFIKSGLKDISLSRCADRSGDWGVAFPNVKGQVVYVWIDALINYISGNQTAWQSSHRRIHFIGKNVWKFHAVYWPALLLSANERLPDQIFVHGFLTVDGKKISKSQGNVIDPASVIESYGADSLRFFLLHRCSPVEDRDFSIRALEESHNTYLVNGLGNLVSRLCSLAQRCGFENINALTKELADQNEELALPAHLKQNFCRLVENFCFDEALALIFAEFDRINFELSQVEPWHNLNGSRLQIRTWLLTLKYLCPLLATALPDTAQAIENKIGDFNAKSEHLFLRKKIPQ